MISSLIIITLTRFLTGLIREGFNFKVMIQKTPAKMNLQKIYEYSTIRNL